jgi:membrane protease YdiL (CAAX protease family)
MGGREAGIPAQDSSFLFRKAARPGRSGDQRGKLRTRRMTTNTEEELNMSKKRILIFVILSYGISWLIWMPNVLARHFDVGWGFSSWRHIAGGLGPFLAALTTTFVFDRGAGVRGYFREKLLRAPDPKWIVIGLGMPILFFVIADLILGLAAREWVNLPSLGLNTKLPIGNPLLIWIAWCVFYGLGEEGGWRGFLFPEFTKRYKARVSTLYVAFIWAGWHLPVFFYDKDLGTMGLVGTVGWVVGLVCGSLLLGWLVKQAGFNLWPVILWHGTFNFFTVSDRIRPLVLGLMSLMVIGAALWIARRYGEDLELPQATPG